MACYFLEPTCCFQSLQELASLAAKAWLADAVKVLLEHPERPEGEKKKTAQKE